MSFQKLRKLKGLAEDPDFLAWMKFKILHPGDIAERPRRRLPPYLSGTRFEPAPRGLQIPVLPPGPEGTDAVFLATGPRQIDPSAPLDSLDVLDPEDRNALWRMAWLAAQSRDAGSAWIRRFLQEEPHAAHPLAWQAYNASERVANWAVFLGRTHAHEKWSKSETDCLAGSLARHARAIWEGLEYYGETYTGNHLSNNARGLLWISLLTGDAQLAGIAERILLNEIDRLILPGGALREGSSHYQFLIARNFLECFWITVQMHLKDAETGLRKRLPSLLEVCRQLRIGDQIATIGDVSPDCVPDFLVQVPEAGQLLLGIEPSTGESVPARGWAAQFFARVPEIQSSCAPLLDEFARLDHDGWSALVHVNSRGYPLAAGHGHRDSGAPVATYRGTPILIDPGRATYNSTGDWARSAHAHSSLLVNGREPEFQVRGVYGEGFLKWRAGPPPELFSDGREIRVSLSQRIHRTISVRNGALEILNEVEGSGTVRLTLLLQLPDSDRAEIQFPAEGQVRKEPALTSPSYGRTLPAVRMRWDARVQLPYKGVIRVIPLLRPKLGPAPGTRRPG